MQGPQRDSAGMYSIDEIKSSEWAEDPEHPQNLNPCETVACPRNPLIAQENLLPLCSTQDPPNPSWSVCARHIRGTHEPPLLSLAILRTDHPASLLGVAPRQAAPACERSLGQRSTALTR